jgi:type IV secretory pathway VirB10-like protein
MTMLMLARRSIAAVASAAVMTSLLTGVYPLGAQESAASKSQATKTKQTTKVDTPTPPENSKKAKSAGRVAPPDPTHRVPPGYSKLGLTDQQKEDIYAIQGKYYPQLQGLEKQLSALRDKRDAETEKVLTPKQRQLLEQQRKAAADARKAAKKAADKEKEKS